MKTQRIARSGGRRSGGRTFSKSGELKKLARKIRKVREGCPRPNTAAVLCIQKFGNFSLCVINK